jgi:hypothetical protein
MHPSHIALQSSSSQKLVGNGVPGHWLASRRHYPLISEGIDPPNRGFHSPEAFGTARSKSASKVASSLAAGIVRLPTYPGMPLIQNTIGA